MVIQQQTGNIYKTYYHMETSNKSFLDMHFFLKSKNISNNKFFLVLYDPDLAGVNPRDPRLNAMMKAKIYNEVRRNFWYFIREIVRIPDQGGTVSGGKPYELHRGNLALNYGFILNWNMFLELPRQFGKTISSLVWYLWVYNFGTTNTEIMFMNKKHDDSKLNLARLKDIRSSLPEFLRQDMTYGVDGTPKKVPENVESITNIITKNKITTKPGARNKANANGIGRGCTMPIHWYDEYAFILHNKIIYGAATPAFSKASKNARANGAPYGILITTTPGDLTTDEGVDAYETKNTATPFDEAIYDWPIERLNDYILSNSDSTFVYIRYTYKQLGADEEYFKQMVKDLKKDWPTIRREVLLEWAVSSSNSPFTQQDLQIVKGLIREPIARIVLNHNYFLNVYKQLTSYRYPPIIGVDVSGGFEKDSSAITVIDSQTTEVIADLNCNYISPPELAKVIYELVISHLPSAIVNIERNGGFGASVIAILKNSKIKRNLYYEYKDRVTEERNNGYKVARRTKTVKVYGFDETRESRNLLMDILRQRMIHHKAKFISPIIYQELCTLEYKKNGRIEHASNAHDDQIFSLLMALYVWYEGKNLVENFGLQTESLSTDDDETIEDGLGEQYYNISSDIETAGTPMINEQLEFLKEASNSKSYDDWVRDTHDAEQKELDQILATNKVAMKAYCESNHLDLDEMKGNGSALVELPQSVFLGVFDKDLNRQDPTYDLQKQFDDIKDLR